MEKQAMRTIAQNKKAYHDYFVEESMEAGIELCGTEVKSLRAGKVNLKDAWCSVVQGELLINGMHISPYEHGNVFNRDPMRVRRLLMHRREIFRLYGLVKQAGYSLIPLSSASSINTVSFSFAAVTISSRIVSRFACNAWYNSSSIPN